MLNKVMLIGNVGRDPEVRSTQSGQPVASFSMATSRKWKDKGGERQEQTEWHNIVVWGRTAELVGQYVTKGRQIYVEGRLQTNSWEDRNTGEKKYRTEIICDTFQLLGKSSQGGGDDSPDERSSSRSGTFSAGSAGWGGGSASEEDDDIPF